MMDLTSVNGFWGKVAIDGEKQVAVVSKIEEAPETTMVDMADVEVEDACENNMIVFCTIVDNRTYLITLPKTCTIRELKELLWSKTG